MRWRVPVAVLALVFAALPGIAPAAAEDDADFISVNQRGTVPVEGDGDAFVWTADLYSLNTFDKIGTFTDRATCSTSAPPPCLVYDVTTTYRVPGGEVTNRGVWSLAPDSTKEGFFFAATRPRTDTIVSGAGGFTGRTGRVIGWGVVDMSQFPARIGIDHRTFIRFEPTDDGVLGRRELIVGHEVPGAEHFQAELFSTPGINKSTEPGQFLIDNTVFSPADGTQIGTVVDRFSCGNGPLPCQVLEGTATITYPEGSVTAHFLIPYAPDPARPGFYLFGSRPTENNIVAATGAFAGRTGRFSASGSVDMRRFPSPIPYEGVGLVVFDD